MAKLEVQINQAGQGHVKLDGVEVKNCCGIRLESEAGKITTAWIQVFGDVDVVIENATANILPRDIKVESIPRIAG